MRKEILNYLSKKISSNPLRVNRVIVSTFLNIRGLQVYNNDLISGLIIRENDIDWKDLVSFKEHYLLYQPDFTFEDLIEMFEFVVSPADKKVNGAVYTPENIKYYIIEQIAASFKGNLQEAITCDVACGCGGFLYSYAYFLHHRYKLSYKYIFEKILYGVDITLYSIERSAIILSLLAVSEGEDDQFQFNLKVGNALDFEWRKEFEEVDKRVGFDIIIGSPPYVCAKNISVESKSLLEKWSVALSGNPDLYIPFFQLALEALNSKGILGYITVNTFTKSLNGRKLREYFHERSLGLFIVDFGGEQVFRGRTTYTCICIIDKTPNPYVSYCLTQSNNLSNLRPFDFTKVPYSSLTDHKGWILTDGDIRLALNKIRSVGATLDRVADVRGGFATLKNQIYVFKPIDQTDSHYLLKTKDGRRYWIERAACRDAVKANSLKTENDLEVYLEKIIFPYQKISSDTELFEYSLSNNKLSIIEEDKFKKQFPDTYSYLSDFRYELSHRDKGGGDYEAWFAYGRSQGLTVQGYKLLFPHISDRPYFVYTEQEDLMFYSGFAIVSRSRSTLKLLQKILNSDLFWFFVKHTSKPYSGEYYGLGKNYIKDFGIPVFTDDEVVLLLNLSDQNEINKFLSEKYDIPIEVFAPITTLEIEIA